MTAAWETKRAQDRISRRQLMLRISTVVVIPVLLLGLAEGALRLFGVGYSTELMTPCTAQGRPASCYNLFFTAPFFPPGMIRYPQPFAIPATKDEKTFRIFVLGESAARGDPDPAYGFSRYLEVMLRQRFPEIKFEVVNTGSVAINSHVVLPIAEQLAKYRPDVFIIYSGNNEVVGPYGPGTTLTSSGMNLSVIRTSIFLRSTRVGQLLTNLGAQKREWRGMEMFLDKQVPATSPLLNRSYANFEANLRDTIDVARASGAQVLVSTVATNLRDCAPFASVHREGLSQQALKSWTALFEQAVARDNAGSPTEGLKLYLAAAQIDDQYAELQFRIARCLWSMGEYAGAKKRFSAARDLDTLRFRADSKINEVNRRVATSVAGAALVDAETILGEESRNGVTGSELVYEHVHLTPEGNYLVGRAMFLQIASKLTGHNLQATEAPSEADCSRLLALTGHDRSRLAVEMMRRMQQPPFTNQINHSDQISGLIARAASQEDPMQTAAEYQWAIAQKPDDHALRYNYGVFLFDHNPAAAVEQLRMARPWDDFPVLTPDGRMIQ